MTSNVGTDLIHRLYSDPARRPDAEELGDALRPELLKSFKPAFLGRCSVVPYFPLADDIIRKITELQLTRIRKRFLENYKANLTWGPALVEQIASRCTEVESGARNIEYILSRGLLPRLSAHVLSIMADGRQVGDIEVVLDESGEFQFSDRSSPESEQALEPAATAAQ